MEAWTSNAINVVLIDIAGTVAASSDETSWIITVYSAAAAVSIVTSHNICKIIGERLYILFAALLFGLASAGCALSATLSSLLAFRILQGLAGGAFMSRTLVLLVTHFDADKRTRPLRYYLLILFAIGRVAAPMASGYFSDVFSWRSLFWVDVVGSLVAAWFFCVAPNQEKLIPPPSRRRLHFDFLGAVLLVVGVTGIQIVMSRGEVDNWLGSPLVLSAFFVGIFANLGFVAWQLSSVNRYPLVHMRHLFTRGLFSVVLLGVLLGTLFSAVIYVFPYYLRLSEIHSAFQAGYLLSVIGLPMFGLAMIAQYFIRMVQKLGGRAILLIGLSLEVLSAGLMVLLMTGDTPDIYLLPSLAFSGAFIFFTAVGLAVAGFANIPIRRISNARTLYFGARQLGNSIGISLGVVLLDRRQAFHSQRLLESFFLHNHSSLASPPHLGMQPGVQEFGNTVMRQASILAYQDMFVAIAIVSVVTIACTCLLPRTKRAAPQPLQDPIETFKEDTTGSEVYSFEAGQP
jgi:EmrB/QacA subfamily drug resistance transporter